MTIKLILEETKKYGILDLSLFKKSLSSKHNLERTVKKCITMGLITKRNESIKLTKKGEKYLCQKTEEDNAKNKKEKSSFKSFENRDNFRNSRNNKERSRYSKNTINKDSDKDKNSKPIKKKVEIKIDERRPELDAKNIAICYDIPTKFSAACMKEAKGYPSDIENVTLEEDRLDLRDLYTVTIDGETSKDFDDAISVEYNDGLYKIGVHIADVSHFVAAGSKLDKEARKRGNSVYLLDTVYPMFPEELSNGLCSLNEGVTRFTMTVFTIIDKNGNIVETSFHKSAIKSRRRLTYSYVEDVINKKIENEDPELIKLITLSNEAKEILFKKRIKNGSIEFNINEVKIKLDKYGNAEDFYYEDRKESEKIIEELMLLANCSVAYRLSNIKGAIYRVHGSPDADKLENFITLAHNRGYTLKKDKDGKLDFHSFILEIKDKPEEKLLLTLMLRTMRQATYETENIGHFGLGFKYYTHFTSPIRRYTDLLTHRLLKTELTSQKAVKESKKNNLLGEYTKYAKWCSKTERIAVDMERDLVKAKSARYMKDKIGNTYKGIISGLAKFGFFVEIEKIGIEGLIRYGDLYEHYIYDEAKQSAYSKDGKKTYTLGDKIEVEVMRVSIKDLFIDFLPS